MKTKYLLLIYIVLLGTFSSCKKDLDVEKLQAEFTVDSDIIQAGQAIVFSDVSSGKVTEWNWKFEGGDIDESILSSPTVIFEQPGKYTVTLEVANTLGVSTLTKEVTVGYNSVEAAFEADGIVVIQGDEISFTDLSVGLIESWEWEFTSAEGVVVKSNEQNPKLNFNQVGVYQAKLTVINPDFSDVEVKEEFIEVLDASNLSIDFSSSTTGTYEGGTIEFTSSSVGTVNSWEWEFEGGTPATSTEEKPTVQYSQPGRYKVKLNGTNIAVTKEKVREGYIVVMPGDKLTAYFPFGGSLNDVGPYKLVPEVRGVVTSAGADRKAYENNAAVFNGSGGLVIADHEAMNFGNDDYTVAFWFKASAVKKMMVWQESGDKGSRDNQAWLRLLSNTTDQLITMATEDATGGSFINLRDNATERGKWQANEWYHVVATRSGLKTSLYINGTWAKDGTSPNGVKVVSNEGAFKIGMQRGTNATDGSFTYGSFYEGMLDDLVIYKKALSPAEVLALFNL